MYKANRVGVVNEDMQDCFPQIPIFREVLKKAGFREYDYAGVECDDVIGILATAIIERDLFKKVIIHSTDQDFYQLVTNRIGVMRGWNKELEGYTVMHTKDIETEIEMPPKDWVKVRALIGDPTDNIPHPLEGIGPKKAIKMIGMGVDPSVEEWAKLPYQVRSQFSPVSGRWKMIRSNYILSHILRTPESERLDEVSRNVLCRDIDRLTHESFLRDKKKLNDESYTKFTDFVVEYEMSELFGQRLDLWKMP